MIFYALSVSIFFFNFINDFLRNSFAVFYEDDTKDAEYEHNGAVDEK